jgi:hypothetical protein
MIPRFSIRRNRSLIPVCLLAAVAGAMFPVAGFSQGLPSVEPSRAVPAPVDYSLHVAPILDRYCRRCHGADAREGGLRMLSRDDLMLRNDSGHVAIVAGRSAESELIRRVTSRGDAQMPPEGEPLTSQQVDILKTWIDAGASWPEGQAVKVRHWAYVPPVRPPVPKVRQTDRLQNAIDAFVIQKLESQQPVETLAPPEFPARLLRRVFLDLTGLPPTPADVDAFVADPSPSAWEAIVDRLLASPRYGEKWAQHWLDLARYADSNGYQADQFRSVWPYRDWVIRAMNQDLPFDQFTIDQLAGDLLPQASADQKVATGFHRCTTCNVEAGVDPEENRTNQVADRVTTTGTVWLGTTLECARCHNHKYDPFTQQDFYQLFAFFNNTPLEVESPRDGGVQYEVAGPMMEVPMTESQRQQRAATLAKIAELRDQQVQRQQRLEHILAEATSEPSGQTTGPPAWQVLAVTRFESAGGASGTIQPDQSVLVSGAAPATDTYTVIMETALTEMSGLRLEALTDPSLPGQGPGRTDEKRPNFILHEVEVTAEPLAAASDVSEAPSAQAVRFVSATADFAQARWAPEGLIDGDPKTGWAIGPQFGKPHSVELKMESPLVIPSGMRLVVRLPQNFGSGRTLGRLRLSAWTSQRLPDSSMEDMRQLARIAPEQRTEGQQQRLQQYFQELDTEMQDLQRQMAALEKSLQEIRPDVTAVMVEMSETRPSFIFKRGDFLNHGAAVKPATPAILHAFQPEAEPSRLDLARWLVSRDNPLTARVTVNRWWSEFFGRGIVDTLEDFGAQGSRPTHPELLDWLAVEFMEQGWSMKHMHKLIVMSAVYQQSSRITPEMRERDPFNKRLARGARLRLSAESIRDNALAVSGLLSGRMGGPPVYPPQPDNIWRHVGRNAPVYDTDTDEDRFRRGVYVVWRRSAPYPSFVNFDAPDRASCVVNRSRSNTPLQALTLMNDPAYVEMAHALARRMISEPTGSELMERIGYGFRLTVSRTPATEELLPLADLWATEAQRYAADPKAAEQVVPASFRLASLAQHEQAAWFVVASVLLNLDETITKN